MATNKDDKPKLPKPKRSYKSAVDKLRNSKKGFGDLKQAEYEESQLPEKLKEQNEQRFLEDIYMPTVTKFVPTDVGEGVTTNPVQRLTEIIRRRQTEEKKESDPSRKVSTEEFIQQNTDYVRPSTTENLPSFNGKREGETVEGRFIPIDLLEKSLGFSYDKIKNNSIVRETLAKYKDLPLKEALSNTKQELSQELSKKVPTITEDPLHYGKKFADGFSQMFISGLKSVAAITNLSATSTGFDIKDSPVYQAAQYLQKKKDEIFTDNKYQQTFSTDLATGIGSMTSFLLPSGIAAKVGLNPTVTSAILGGLFNSGDAFQEAYEKTGDLKKAYISLTANFGLGLTESLPIANMLGRLGKLTGRNVSRDLAAGLFAGYLTEGTQEFGQQFGSEVIGKLLGVHDRSVGEMFGNSIYAGSLGGIIGSSMNIAGIGGKYGLSSLRTTGLTKKLSNADLTKMQDLHGLLSNIEKDFATLTKKDQEGIIRALSNKSVGYNLINLTEGKEGTSVTLEDLDETKGLSEDEETRYSINIPLIKTLAERLKNENKKSDTGQTDIDKRGTDTKTVQGEEGKEIKQGDNKELPKSDKPNGLQQPKEDQGTDSERGFLEQEFKEKSERLKQLYTAQQETEDPVELESIKKESETLISELENIQNELNTVPETEVTPESPKESVPETKEEKQPEKKEEKNYSSTQVNIPENQTGQFKEFSESIPEEDIYSEEGYGRETEPHITALYGLHTADPNKVKEILEDSGEIEAELGETKVFENDDYDVLVVEVKSDGLNKINKTLSDNLEYTNSYDGYKPHLTIAYLKKGTGKKYAGNKKFAGQKFNFRELLFSDKLRNKFPITLKKDVSKKSISEQPEKKISKYQQDRIQGFKTINGKRYDRQEVIDDIEVGKETEINFTKDVKVKGHYALIPAEKLQSSHDIDGKQNPKHFIPEAQPRNRSALEVLKSEPKKKGENLDPKQVGLSNTAYTGSPIVNERGELIQGTGRSQALNYYFEKFEGDPKQYYEHLKEISSLTGLSEKAIDDMIELYGNVALVRVVNATDEAAIKLGNYKSSEMEDVTGSITGIDKAAVNRLSAEELDEFVKLMTKNLEADAGISLKDIIRQGGRDILNNLIKIGAIREDEIALYLNNLGTITNVGTDNIYNFFKELLFRGGEADLSEYFENLPHQTKAGLEKSIVLIVGLPEEKSLILEVQNAIIGYTQYLSAEENQPLLTLKDWLETPSMFGEANEDIYSPAEQLIMKTLNKPKRQKDISDFFANYYNLVKDKPADLFNPEIQKGLSKEEVFNNILNDNGQKPKTSSKPDKKKESKPEQEPKDNAGSETDVDEKGTGKEVRKKFSDYPELQSDLEIPKRIKAINDIAEKYGWRTETSEDFVDLYNRNDKKVATVKIKYDKKVGTYRFNITDSGGSKVRDIRAVTLEDLDRSLNNSLQEDFYAQLLPEQSKKSTGKETFESDAEKLKKQSDDIDNDLNDFPFQKKKTLENIGDLTIRLEQQEKRKADVEKKIEETKKLGKGEITKRQESLFQKEQEVFNSLTEQLKGLLGSVQQIKKSFPNIDIILTDSAGVKRKLLQAGNELAKQKDFKSPLGFVSRKEGKVYINSEKADMTTPIHEVAGHIFMLIIKEQNPSLYKTGLKLAVQDKEIIEYVKKYYPEIRKEGVSDENNAALLDEVLATAIGRDFADLYKDVKNVEVRQGLIDKFKDWITKVINNIKLRFRKQYEDQPEIVRRIDAMPDIPTLKNWTNALAQDISEGKLIDETSSKELAEWRNQELEQYNDLSFQKDAKKNLEKIRNKYSETEYNQNNYEVGGGLDNVKFASRRHEDAKSDIGKLTIGKATQMFKNATGEDIETVKDVIELAVPNPEWHHAGKLPKKYGGGMKKTYFINSKQIVDIADKWDEYLDKAVIRKGELLKKETLENSFDLKLSEYLNKNAERVERTLTKPKHFFVTNTEMKGKYGWFDASNKSYNLPVYYSGWKFESEEKLNKYKEEYINNFLFQKSVPDIEDMIISKSPIDEINEEIKNSKDVYLRSLTTLPAGIKFENQGGVYLRSLTTLTADVKFENQGDVDLSNLKTLSADVEFENQGDVDLSNLKTLSADVEFNNGENVYLPKLTELSADVEFNNGENVYLPKLTELSADVKFNNGGRIDLDYLIELSVGVKFNNGKDVYIPRLTGLSDNVIFNNKGNVDLPNITELPEGVVFKNSGDVDLPRLIELPEGVKFENTGYINIDSLDLDTNVIIGGKKNIAINFIGLNGYSVTFENEGHVTINDYSGNGEIRLLNSGIGINVKDGVFKNTDKVSRIETLLQGADKLKKSFEYSYISRKINTVQYTLGITGDPYRFEFFADTDIFPNKLYDHFKLHEKDTFLGTKYLGWAGGKIERNGVLYITELQSDLLQRTFELSNKFLDENKYDKDHIFREWSHLRSRIDNYFDGWYNVFAKRVISDTVANNPNIKEVRIPTKEYYATKVPNAKNIAKIYDDIASSYNAELSKDGKWHIIKDFVPKAVIKNKAYYDVYLKTYINHFVKEQLKTDPGIASEQELASDSLMFLLDDPIFKLYAKKDEGIEHIKEIEKYIKETYSNEKSSQDVPDNSNNGDILVDPEGNTIQDDIQDEEMIENDNTVDNIIKKQSIDILKLDELSVDFLLDEYSSAKKNKNHIYAEAIKLMLDEIQFTKDKNTIKDKLKGDSGLSMLGLSKLNSVDKEFVQALYRIGKHIYNNYSKKVSEWRDRLLNEVGEWVRKHLETILKDNDSRPIQELRKEINSDKDNFLFQKVPKDTHIEDALRKSGDQFEQVVGRVSRRNTVTPAWVKQMYVNLAITDVRRRQINEEKMRILHAVQEGKDADLTSILAGYNSANQDEENFVFQKDTKELTEEEKKANFDKWFEGSKVVDNNGEPLEVYHATTQDFTVFDIDKANPKGHYGRAFYFTDSETDADENYQGDGADLQSRIEFLAERIEANEGISSKRALAKATKQLKGKSDKTMSFYLSMKYPADLTDEGDYIFEPLGYYDEETDEFIENEDSETYRLYDIFQEIQHEFEGLNATDLWNDISTQLGDFSEPISLKQLDIALRNSNELLDVSDYEGNLISYEVIRRIYEELGFDGIIMDADKRFGSKSGRATPMNMDYDTKHYIVFKPTQIKSSTDNSGEYGIDQPDFLMQKDTKTIDDVNSKQFKNKLEKAGLIAIHNISEEKLIYANRIGGIAMPSIAITGTEQEYTNFGEISLIAHKDMIDPARSSTKVYPADRYSARYPTTHYFPNREKIAEAYKSISDIYTNRYDGSRSADKEIISSINDRGESHFKYNNYNYILFRNKFNLPVKDVPAEIENSKREIQESKEIIGNKDISYYSLSQDNRFKRLALRHFTDIVNEYPDLQSTYFDYDDELNSREIENFAQRILRDIKSEGRFNSEKTRYAIEDYIKKNKLEKKYKDFHQNLYEQLGTVEKIFKGYTYSGNRRYSINSLANAVKEMKRDKFENYFYGAGSVRGRTAKPFKTLQQIKDSRSKIVSGELMDKLKEEMNTELITLANTMKPFYHYQQAVEDYSYNEIFGEELADFVKKGSMPSFDNITVGSREAIWNFLKKLHDLPTEYFEAKIEREVPISEFKAAIVPKDISDKTLGILQEAGLDVRYYESPIQSRRSVIKEEFDDLVFQKDTSNQDLDSLLRREATVEEINEFIRSQNTIVIRTDVGNIQRERFQKNLFNLDGLVFENMGGVVIAGGYELNKPIKFKNRGEVEFENGVNLVAENITFENTYGVRFDRVLSIPENTTFNNGGDVSFNMINTLPATTIFKNANEVTISHIDELKAGVVFENSGNVRIKNVLRLRNDVRFANGNNVYINNIGEQDWTPERLTFDNLGSVNLGDIDVLTKGINFQNGNGVNIKHINEIESGYVFFNLRSVLIESVDKIGEGVKFLNTGEKLLTINGELPKSTEFAHSNLKIQGLKHFPLLNIHELNDVYLYNVETYDDLQAFNNAGELYLPELKEIKTGDSFSNAGDIMLDSVTEIPDNVQFTNEGHVQINSAKTIGTNVVFNNFGNVLLRGIKEIKSGTIFQNGKDVLLDSVKKVFSNTKFQNGGDVEMPEIRIDLTNVRFDNRGSVDLDFAKTIGQDVVFNNNENVFLRSINTYPKGSQFFNGGTLVLGIKTLPNTVSMGSITSSQLTIFPKLEKLPDRFDFTRFRDLEFHALKEMRKGITIENMGRILMYYTGEMDEVEFRNSGAVVIESPHTLETSSTVLRNVWFANIGDINLEIPDLNVEGLLTVGNEGDFRIESTNTPLKNITFENEGGVDIVGTLEIGEEVYFRNIGHTILRGTTTIQEGQVFENVGNIAMRKLNYLPDNVVFANTGDILLDNLEEMGTGIKYSELGHDSIHLGRAIIDLNTQQLPPAAFSLHTGTIITPTAERGLFIPNVFTWTKNLRVNLMIVQSEGTTFTGDSNIDINHLDIDKQATVMFANQGDLKVQTVTIRSEHGRDPKKIYFDLSNPIPQQAISKYFKIKNLGDTSIAGWEKANKNATFSKTEAILSGAEKVSKTFRHSMLRVPKDPIGYTLGTQGTPYRYEFFADTNEFPLEIYNKFKLHERSMYKDQKYLGWLGGRIDMDKGIMYVTEIQSDLLQRTNELSDKFLDEGNYAKDHPFREWTKLRSKIENHFKGWYYIFANSSFQNALKDKRIKEIWLPTQEFYTSHVSGAKNISEIYEKISELYNYEMSADGKWRVIKDFSPKGAEGKKEYYEVYVKAYVKTFVDQMKISEQGLASDRELAHDSLMFIIEDKGLKGYFDSEAGKKHLDDIVKYIEETYSDETPSQDVPDNSDEGGILVDPEGNEIEDDFEDNDIFPPADDTVDKLIKEQQSEFDNTVSNLIDSQKIDVPEIEELNTDFLLDELNKAKERKDFKYVEAVKLMLDDIQFQNDKKIIKDKLKGNNDLSFLGLSKLNAIDKDFVKAVIRAGKYLYNNVSKKFREWSMDMANALGQWVEKHLPVIFENVESKPEYKFEKPKENIADPDSDIEIYMQKDSHSNDKSIEDALKKFGIPIPQKTTISGEIPSGKEKIRKFTLSVGKHPEIEKEIKQEVKNSDWRFYNQIPNAQTIQEAINWIENTSEDEVLSHLYNDQSEIPPRIRNAAGIILARAYDKDGAAAMKSGDKETASVYFEKSIQILKALSQEGTRQGQGVQAFAILGKWSPEQWLYQTAKGLSRSQAEFIDEADKRKKLIEHLINRLNIKTVEGLDQFINEQVESALEKEQRDIDISSPDIKDLPEAKLPEDLENEIDVMLSEIDDKDIIKAIKRLAGRIAVYPKDFDPINYMVNTLYKIAVENDLVPAEIKRKAQDKIPMIELIGNAVKNKEQFTEVWDKAKKLVQQRYGKDEKALKELNQYFSHFLQEPFSKSQVISVTGKAIKELEIKINEIVKKHYSIQERKKKELVDKLIDEAGLTREQAMQLSKAIEQRFDEITTEAKHKILEKTLKNPLKILGKKNKELYEKIIELSNLGALSDEEYTKLFAERFEIKSLNPDQAAEIVKKAEAIELQHEGFKKNELIVDMLNYIQKVNGIKISDAHMGLWYASILSGVSTHQKNILFNLFNLVIETMNRNPAELQYVIPAMLKAGLDKGILEGWDIMKKGLYHYEDSKYFASNVLELYEFKGGNANPMNYAKYVGRSLTAEDRVFYHMFNESESSGMAYSIAKSEGLSGKDLQVRMSELLGNSEDQIALAKEQAKDEGYTGIEYKRRVYELIVRGRDTEIFEQAKRYAMRGTLNYTPKGVVGALTRGIESITHNKYLKPTKFIIPFTRILANLTNNLLDFSPVGYYRAVKGDDFGVKGLEGREFTREINRATFGTLLAATLGIWISTLDDDEDNYFDITGNGFNNYDKNKQLEPLGWKPFTVKIGVKRFNFLNTPIAVPLVVLGSIRDMYKYETALSEAALHLKMSALLTQFATTMTNFSFISGLIDFMGIFDRNKPNKAEQYFTKLGAGIVGAAVPNFLKQFGIFHDDTMYDVDTFTEMVIRNWGVGGLYGLNPRVNVLGEVIKRDNPFIPAEVKRDKAWELIIKHKAFISGVDESTPIYDQVNGEDRIITPDEHFKLVKESGDIIKQTILDNYEDLSKENPEVIRDQIDKITDFARKKIKEEISTGIESEGKFPYKKKEVEIKINDIFRDSGLRTGSNTPYTYKLTDDEEKISKVNLARITKLFSNRLEKLQEEINDTPKGKKRESLEKIYNVEIKKHREAFTKIKKEIESYSGD